MPDWENTQIPRDQWGRPMVMPPKGKTRTAYRRTTTFVKCLDSGAALQKWYGRLVAYGMSQRPDLTLAASATDLTPGNKRQLQSIADKAHEYAKGIGGDAAEMGTALHALTERVDRGEKLGPIPTAYQADIDAYRKATQAIQYHAIETFRVHDQYKVAGTADRIGTLNGKTMIMDIKTGSIDYPHAMAMQLAMYAHSLPYDIAEDLRGTDEPAVDLNHGVIIHLPVGQGRCDLYEIDIAVGWGACLLAKKVWEWRDRKNLTSLIDTDAARALPATWESLIAGADTVERLREIWLRAKELGELTLELREQAVARHKELEP